MLGVWSAFFADTAYSPAKNVTIRISDALAAFLVGLHMREGREFARAFYGHLDDAAVVAAIIRMSECDDIELRSCVTPGAVVVPVALSQAGSNPAGVEQAIAAGYTAGTILGIAINGAEALPEVWPTLLAAPLMAAVTRSSLTEDHPGHFLNSMALSLAGASGRLGRITGSPSGRWFAFAQAVDKGLTAAAAAARGFVGDGNLVTPIWLTRQAGAAGPNLDSTAMDRLADLLGSPAGFKPFPVARQAVSAIEAFRRILDRGVAPAEIETVKVFVRPADLTLLNRQVEPADRLTLLCNLGIQLGCAALRPDVLYDAERNSAIAEILAFARRVSVLPTRDFDKPAGCWPARVEVLAAGNRIDREEIFGIPLDRDDENTVDLLHEKWRRILHGDDRRDFFENVVNAPPGSHVMLWNWVKQRLAQAAQSGAAA